MEESANQRSNKRIWTMVVPAIAAAFLIGAIPGAALLGAQSMKDEFPVRGYVEVSVVRDGQEIYHYEDHNLITNAGKDFIREQIGQTSGSGAIDSNGANYIALSTTDITPAAGDTTLSGEITSNGLERAQGAYAEVSTNQYTITKTFTAAAGSTHSNVRSAGLFTASSGGTMLAINEFTPVSLEEFDQLTLTWTLTLS